MLNRIKMQNKKIEGLASERSTPCVTISMITHQTHPANSPDLLSIQGLLKEAKNRVIKEYGAENVQALLRNIAAVEEEIDVAYLNYSLHSLHIFLSNTTKEIIKSLFTIPENTVMIDDRFALKSLIKDFNQSEEYYILLLSQSGAQLFHTLNNHILEEIKNEDFPFDERLKDQKIFVEHHYTDPQELTDPGRVEIKIREYLNVIDKAVVKMARPTELRCVVVCTEHNYSRLMNIADVPSIYMGFTPINYNDTSPTTLANDAWKIVNNIQQKHIAEEVKEMQEAVGHGLVFTDLSEIFRAAKEGKGDLLIVDDDFHQAVKMNGALAFDLVADSKQADVIDDITSEIAWDVFSKKGRVVFVNHEEIKSLGKIALKVRY
jgi:hypothetical protein